MTRNTKAITQAKQATDTKIELPINASVKIDLTKFKNKLERIQEDLRGMRGEIEEMEQFDWGGVAGGRGVGREEAIQELREQPTVIDVEVVSEETVPRELDGEEA